MCMQGSQTMHHQALWAKPRLRALRLALRVVLLAALGAPGCALYEDTVPLGPKAVFVEVEPAILDLGVGEAQQLSAIVYAEDDEVLSGRKLAWLSLDEGVAAVSESGAITGVSPGVARIRAETGGHVGTAEVHVFYPVVSVEIRVDDTVLFPGDRVKAQAGAYNINGELLGDRGHLDGPGYHDRPGRRRRFCHGAGGRQHRTHGARRGREPQRAHRGGSMATGQRRPPL